MADQARYTTTSPRPKWVAFVFAVTFAVTMAPLRLANAEQDLNVSRAACDLAKKHSCEELVQDNILWRIDDPDNPASKHWLQKNLDELCACTTDPYATVNCFQIQVNNNGKPWQEAISTCRAKP